jgi:hypothetical protein
MNGTTAFVSSRRSPISWSLTGSASESGTPPYDQMVVEMRLSLRAYARLLASMLRSTLKAPMRVPSQSSGDIER